VAAETEVYDAVRRQLADRYARVFTDAAIDRHVATYVRVENSERLLDAVQAATGLGPGQRAVDLGCGFGSFVLACVRRGIDAVGIDVDPSDLAFARARLQAEWPHLDHEAVYRQGDARNSGLPSASADLVTAWNVLEHVERPEAVIAEAWRVLRPGGYFVGVAPNYCAFRREAHYDVPWLPLLPRRAAAWYLRRLGRDASFFERDIHYVTNRGVRRALRSAGFTFTYPELAKIDRPEAIESPRTRRVVRMMRAAGLGSVIKLAAVAYAAMPLKGSITFTVQKRP
jgi:MPBQ/MSBQ methyltransferase